MDAWGTSSTDYFGIWVNKAYLQLCSSDHLFGVKRRINFRELETSTTASTVDGTAYVSTPADALLVRDIYDSTNDAKLHWIPYTKYVGYTDRADTSAEGDPTEWTRAGANIYLHPTPGSVITETIYYKKRPSELAGDLQTIIGAEWDDVIVALAAYQGFRTLGDFGAAKSTREELIERLTGMTTIYNDEEASRSDGFGPDPAYMRR